MPDERIDPPYSADERTMLDSWLEWHRGTLATKCEGLSDEQLRERSVPPSPLSLLGLVRHMAEVERSWFQRRIGGLDVPMIYCPPDDRDGDFDRVDTADVEADKATWLQQCERSREILANVKSLDETGLLSSGEKVSVRWVLVHMIEEYARHNGHADFLRERIDGATGD